MTHLDFDAAVERFREVPVTPPSLMGVQGRVSAAREANRGRAAEQRRLARWCLVMAAFGYVLVPLGRLVWAWKFDIIDPGYLMLGTSTGAALAMMVLAVGAWLVRRDTFGAQLMARAIAASNVVVGLLLAGSSSGLGAAGGAVVACACGGALWQLGRGGLEPREGDHSFSPIAYRSFLVLALVMAFADAQTLLFSSAVQITTGLAFHDSDVLLRAAGTGVAGAVMAINVWGLYRLRVWAMFANIVTNIVVAVLALGGDLGLTISVSAMLALTATLQLLLPVPILATALGDRRAGRWPIGWRSIQFALLLMMGGSVVLAAPKIDLVRTEDGWVEMGSGRRPTMAMPVSGAHGSYWTGELSGLEMANQIIPDIHIWEADLEGSDFSGADLRRVDAAQSSFVGVDFRQARLGGAGFHACDLRRADLRGTRIHNVDFGGSDLTDARLERSSFVATVCPDHSWSDDWGGTCEGHRRLPPPSASAPTLAGSYVSESARFPYGRATRDELAVSLEDGYVVYGFRNMAPDADGAHTIIETVGPNRRRVRLVPVRDAASSVVAIDLEIEGEGTFRLRRLPGE